MHEENSGKCAGENARQMASNKQPPGTKITSVLNLAGFKVESGHVFFDDPGKLCITEN